MVFAHTFIALYIRLISDRAQIKCIYVCVNSEFTRIFVWVCLAPARHKWLIFLLIATRRDATTYTQAQIVWGELNVCVYSSAPSTDMQSLRNKVCANIELVAIWNNNLYF